MGRHSAPDAGDEDEDAAAASGAVLTEAPGRGRHARTDEGDEPAGAAPADAGAPDAGEPDAGEPDAGDGGLDLFDAGIRYDEFNSTPLQSRPAPKPTKAPKPGKPPKPPTGTASDLALVRSHPDVRNRGIAAALAPFVVYVVVMLVIGRADVFVIWLWIPLVVAGVLVGLMLDIGHKRYSNKS